MAAHGILQRDYRTLEKARQDFRPQDFSGFPEFLDPPAAEERDAVGMLRGEVEIVQDGEHAVTLLRQGARFGEQRVLMCGIEARDRLVEQDGGGFFGIPNLSRRSSKGRPLPLAAGEACAIAALKFHEVHASKHVAGGGANFVGGAALRQAAEFHRFENRETSGASGILPHHGATPRSLDR